MAAKKAAPAKKAPAKKAPAAPHAATSKKLATLPSSGQLNTRYEPPAGLVLDPRTNELVPE